MKVLIIAVFCIASILYHCSFLRLKRNSNYTIMAEQAECDNSGIRAIAQTTSQFANNFLKIVANDTNLTGNLITSPLCAQVVLAMTAYGAGGSTADQMRSALFIPSNDELGQSGYQSLIESLNAVNGVELRLANKIYTASHFEVKPVFTELTAKKFLSSNEKVDFNDSSSTANTINTWCEDQTNKRITDVVDPGSLDPRTLLMLVTAVYFKGQWENKFNPYFTQDRPFHIDEKTTKDIPTMFIKKKFRFGGLPNLNATFIELPYQGQEVSMIIILPDEINGLKTVQENLHGVDLSQTLKDSDPREVNVFLPKFKIESTLDLEKTLRKLGMIDMFENQADFSGITDTSVKVSSVVQKAFIEVNEEGSEAAAVTRMKILKKCYKRFDEFVANRPFYYEIRSALHNVPLFTGLYVGQQ